MPVAPLSPLLLDLITEGWDPPWREPAAKEGPAKAPASAESPPGPPTPMALVGRDGGR